MNDLMGRTVDYLRISVTDRCNLRCRYCMPPEGVSDIGHREILRYDEILVIVKTMAQLGIKKIKVTGGEPLVRRGTEELIRELAAVEGIEEVTLTTNGVMLEERLPALIQAGIRNINISLDTLDRERYKALAGADMLEKVRGAVSACLADERIRLKINCISLADTPKEDFISLARIAEKNCADVRFIEVMPIGMGKTQSGISADTLFEMLEESFGKGRKVCERRGNGPAEYFEFEGFKGKIGFISAVSHRFCTECNRIRLTADGILKPCLASEYGVNLKALLRNGAGSDGAGGDRLAEHIRQAIEGKAEGHCFNACGKPQDRVQGERLMSQIGG